MTSQAPDPFDHRVPESRVAAVLASIAAPPRKRGKPQPGDIDGDFDFWFDGGACKFHTGSAHYHFTDGAAAVVACPASWLWVQITFGDGERVEIHQVKPQQNTGK
jgi:hypothetical protein